MQTYEIKVNYASPLLMKSTKGVNPMEPLVKEQKALTGKGSKKRTDADVERLLEIDYELGAYYDETIGMYVPAEMMEASIREGFKANRLGEKAKVAIFVREEKIPLIYEGPRTLEDLFKEPEFKDVRVVTVNKAKVIRCRPRFNRWQLNFTLDFDEAILDQDQLLTALDVAGRLKGIGDYRPRYGRYATKIKQVG